MDNKIDFVITWVDDRDKNWMKKKKFWQEQFGIKTAQDERYRNWDNLHYQFRAIEKYAPWVNHIYLVTDQQRPKWLELDGNNVSIVDHTEIIPEEYLPTYNSNVIELYLHKIQNLSEKFVYFNDDVFIIDKVEPDDFFKNDLPRERAGFSLLTPVKDEIISNVLYNNSTLLNDYFKKNEIVKANPFKWINIKNGSDLIRTLILSFWTSISTFKQSHLSTSFNKETFNEVWDIYGEELKSASKEKFRSKNDYSQWLFKDWQLASNKFEPRKHKFGHYATLFNENDVDNCSRYIEEQKAKVICVNDGPQLENFEYAKKTINSSFNCLYPEKSKYEI